MSGIPAGAAPPAPLRGTILWVTALALALGTFMQVLDSTIANVSLPTIAGNLGESTDSGTWVITSFAVANGISLPLTGWLMGRFGVVRTFLVSIILFTIASLLCGLAWSLESLVVFRIVQGAVSGPMIPGSQTLLIAIFPPGKRATALAIWSITTLVAPLMGPILGGYISDNYHWSWIFLINVPIGIIAVLVPWRAIAAYETPTHRRPINKVSVLLLAFWVGSLQLGLDLGKNAGWFDAWEIVLLASCAVVGFLAWIIWESTDSQPVVDLSLFRRRNFSIGLFTFCTSYAVLFANTLLLPLWLQTQLGYTATWAGLVSAPSGAVAIVLTPFVAKFGDRIDMRALAAAAFGLFGLSFLLRAELNTGSAFVDFVLPMVVQGIAMSAFFVPMVNIILDGIPPESVPSATGLTNFARITAGSFAASLITTLWDRRDTIHQSRLTEVVTADSPAYRHAVEQLGDVGLDPLQAADVTTRLVVGQSYLLSSIDLFTVCGWLSIAMAALVWLTRRPASHSGPVAMD